MAPGFTRATGEKDALSHVLLIKSFLSKTSGEYFKGEFHWVHLYKLGPVPVWEQPIEIRALQNRPARP